MGKVIFFAMVLMTALVIGRPAHAYLDPGSASVFLQLVIGAIAGAAVGIRLYWTRLKRFFSDRFGRTARPAGRGEVDPPAGV